MFARIQKWFAKRAAAKRQKRYSDGAAYALHALFFAHDRPAEARKLEAYTTCSKDFGFADVFDDGIRDVVAAYDTGALFPVAEAPACLTGLEKRIYGQLLRGHFAFPRNGPTTGRSTAR